ncbi:hypothetical protein GCM10009541_19770 [Micromonospora gifhornensis]
MPRSRNPAPSANRRAVLVAVPDISETFTPLSLVTGQHINRSTDRSGQPEPNEIVYSWSIPYRPAAATLYG